MLDYDAAMLKKKHQKKKAEAVFMPINWNPFYDIPMILIR